MVNKDKLKEWCLEHFKGVKVKVTNGSEKTILKTNIKKTNPTIYKINLYQKVQLKNLKVMLYHIL